MGPWNLAAALVLAATLPAQHVHTDRHNARRLPLPREDGVWHFVVFGDRTGGSPSGIKILEQAVADTNLLDPDIVMTVGDMVQGYNATPAWMEQMREFRGVMAGLRMPWYPVAGNHDVFWRQRGTEEKRPRNEHDDSYEKHFGPLWYWFEHKDAAFVVLYTDETDPTTGDKNYHVPGGQRMSEEQRTWLEKTLARTREYAHCFVFLHHPRWITARYPHSDWAKIEKMLQIAGNVSAVFAGHIHRMHFAEAAASPGGRPLPYYTLATTGGNVAAGELGKSDYDHAESVAGYLHHLNVVTVRKSRISVSALPVGAVIDPRTMTDETQRQVKQLRERARSYDGTPIDLRQDGSARGLIRLVLDNPTPRPVAFTLTPDPKSSRVAFWPDHAHLTVQPNAKREVTFHYARGRRGLSAFPAPVIVEQAEWLGEKARIAAPRRSVALRFSARDVVVASTRGTPGVLHLDGESDVRIVSDAASPPDGPLTVEGWVWAESLKGRRPFINKTEESEYGIFMDDGRARFIIHLGGRYVEAMMPEGTTLEPRQWHHLAGVFDGRSVRLYVDGREVASLPGSGERTKNAFPLFIGADPDKNGKPIDHLHGRIDEVRLSSIARYTGTFEPSRHTTADEHTLLLFHLDREIGPLIPDSGPHRRHGAITGSGRCGETLRPPKR